MGANDKDRQGTFVWEDDRELSSSYSEWGSGQPNNADEEFNPEDCVEMYSSGSLDDVNCAVSRGVFGVVCQKLICSKGCHDCTNNGPGKCDECLEGLTATDATDGMGVTCDASSVASAAGSLVAAVLAMWMLAVGEYM